MKKLGFIGLGNMGRAICSGLIAGGAVAAEDIYGYAPHAERLRAYARQTGIHACASAAEVVQACDTVLIAVKPYVIEGVLAELRDGLKGKALLSVAAGWPLERYRPLLDVALGYNCQRLTALLDPTTRAQFIMPNTPALVGAGILLFEQESTLLPDERAEIMEKFKALGMVEELPSRLMGVGGSISGCGPAFCAMAIEALADAGVKYGLPRVTAYRLASGVLAGTGELQLKTGDHPAAIKDGVCSPAGSTIRGVEALEKHGLRTALIEAVNATLEVG